MPRWGLLILTVLAGCAGLTKPHGDGLPPDPVDGEAAHEVASNSAFPTASVSLDDDAPVTKLRINNDIVTAEDILGSLLPQLRRDASTMSAEAYGRRVATLVTDAVRLRARELLLYQEAAKRMTPQEETRFEQLATERIKETVTRDYGGRQARFEKALAERGSTIEKERERVRRELIIQRYLYSTIGRKAAEPTRQQLWNFYQQRKNDRDRPEKREMHLIEVGRDGRDTDDARRAIESAAAALAGGGTFAETARQYSRGIHASDGGAWGAVTRGGVRERWQPAVDVLFTLEPGQVSNVVETPQAFFIVKCGEIQPALPADFARMQPALVARYREYQFEIMLNELVAQLQARSTFDPPLSKMERFLRGVAGTAPRPRSE